MNANWRKELLLWSIAIVVLILTYFFGHYLYPDYLPLPL